MEIVINIPEEDYKKLHSNEKVITLSCDIVNVIRNGTPLSKGHGRLIDADALIDTLGCSDRDIYVEACIKEYMERWCK